MLHDLTDDDSFVYSNAQLRTERYGDKEKGKDVKDLLYSRKSLNGLQSLSVCL